MAEVEPATLFEKRKQDHIRIAMDPRAQANGFAGFDFLRLEHEALPELNFSEVQIRTTLLNKNTDSPFYISSMTAGHEKGEAINSRLATFSQDRNILMGVGSQRRELADPEAVLEWKRIRRLAPKAKLVGNLGIAQVIQANPQQIQKLVDNLEAVGLFVHLNALQECVQPEGTPSFRGGLKAIEVLVQKLSVPVIVKEVGCGMSLSTVRRLVEVGVSVVDVSGLGGTHWGRIEGLRSDENSPSFRASVAFKDWGVPTVESLMAARQVCRSGQIWASGGVRTGLDAAKLIALGASAVGIAKPFLEAALQSEKSLHQQLDQLEYELKIALFCTGSLDLQQLMTKKVLL